MKTRFDLTCCCGAPNYCEIEKEKIVINHPFVTDCMNCKKTIALVINALDTNKKAINYTVQVRESVK